MILFFFFPLSRNSRVQRSANYELCKKKGLKMVVNCSNNTMKDATWKGNRIIDKIGENKEFVQVS